MEWNCTATEERLIDFLDGTLTPEEAQAFSTHTAGCHACARMVERVGGLVARMRRIEPVEEPAGLTVKILDATLGPQAKREGWQRWFSWTPVLWQPRFVMGVATVAATLIIVFHALVPDARSVTLADLNPVTLMRAANRQAHLSYARGAKFVNDLRVVYEIQSRLTAEPESTPAHEEKMPPSEPREKSSVNPKKHPASGSLLAFALTSRTFERQNGGFTRSSP